MLFFVGQGESGAAEADEENSFLIGELGRLFVSETESLEADGAEDGGIRV